MITTTTGTRMRWVTAERHHERVRRWRWFPWPLKDYYWAALSYPDIDCGSTIIADSLDELSRLIPEHVRFIYEDEHCGVGWLWKP